ncbi:hypothetical protein AOR_1_192134 [Paecilomyces variotii No. 5]|uniref:Uncharacterized protein n=1 Tax=Byssochlamys spectabilis (strain No. 5 / NBRC 109023) TaxID=1356009 RepID=V5GD34_BYSSN|nr:hypothetical protein AOR_1_192134 [Paecilomyces variotii No. 5]
MGNKQNETLAQSLSKLLPIMAVPSDTKPRRHSPYHDRAATGTESLPNLNSPRLTSISDAADTLPRHFQYPSGWLSSRIGRYPLPPIQHTAVRASVQHSACTHCTMTRKFDDNSNDTCDICHRKSGLGWLYVCTEDHGGFIPADQEYSSTLCRESCDPDMKGETSLSPWIDKAIQDGFYTTDQIQILKLQRAGVEEVVSMIRSPTPASSVTHISESSYTEDTDEEAWTETIEDINKPDVEPEPEHSVPSMSGPEIVYVRPQAHPICRLMCCHNCRPASRDRSWASLNAVCNEMPVNLPPPWDISNRRVSDTNVVRKLGLHNADINRPSTSDISPRPKESLKQDSPPDHSVIDLERNSKELLDPRPSPHGRIEETRGSTETKAKGQPEWSQTQPSDPVPSNSPRRGGIYLIKRNQGPGSTPSQGPAVSRGEHIGKGHVAKFQTRPTSSKSRHWSMDSESDSEIDVPGGVALTEEG